MRVNSAFTGLFTHRLVVKSCIIIAMILCISGASAAANRDRETQGTELETPTGHDGRDRDLRAKQVNLIIRQIGHQLLLQAGDSTSRVLPVKEIKKGTFQLRFENEFVFNHDSLMTLAMDLLPKAQFPSGYTVTVLDCIKAGIVFGFQLNNTSPDLLACRGRREPIGCYLIEFTFPDFYEKVEQEKADIGQLTEEHKSFKADAPTIVAKLEKIKTDNDILKLSAESKPPQETHSKPEEFKAATFSYPLINLVYSVMLISLGVTLVIARFGKILTPARAQNQDHIILKESAPELPALGKFLFDVKGQRLVLESEVISLTEKECKILELLHESFGELVPRETLMQKIWLNEGVITGRSLDMFVSKLRKKLSGDPELRITNVHGKGYILAVLEQ